MQAPVFYDINTPDLQASSSEDRSRSPIFADLRVMVETIDQPAIVEFDFDIFIGSAKNDT